MGSKQRGKGIPLPAFVKRLGHRGQTRSPSRRDVSPEVLQAASDVQAYLEGWSLDSEVQKAAASAPEIQRAHEAIPDQLAGLKGEPSSPRRSAPDLNPRPVPQPLPPHEPLPAQDQTPAQAPTPPEHLTQAQVLEQAGSAVQADEGLAVVSLSSSQHDLKTIWQKALSKFEKLRQEEPNLKAWEFLDKISDPQKLLSAMRSSSYIKATDRNRVISLVEASLGAVMRFDKEISAVMSGLSHVSFGASNIIWGGLGAVFHVAEDFLKTRGTVFEIITKIFATIPRIYVYYDLFGNQPDSLDIGGLTVTIFESVVQFNIDWITWSSTASGKFIILKEDPRKRFQKVFTEIEGLSEDIRKQTQALQWKEQREHQHLLVERFEAQEKRIETLSHYLVDRAELEANASLEAIAAEKERFRYYLAGTGTRRQFWKMLHADGSWEQLQEHFLTLISIYKSTAKKEPWTIWKSGRYRRTYGAFSDSEPLARIYLDVNWDTEEDGFIPSVRWTIDTPNSLFHPGLHSGNIELIPLKWLEGEYRACFTWTSKIFSTLPSQFGTFSSSGEVEENPAALVITRALDYFADELAKGPYDGNPGFWGRGLGGTVNDYKIHCGQDHDKFMRAAAFFANAFTRHLEGIEALEGSEIPEQCREESKVPIAELANGYGFEAVLQENARTDASWDVTRTYDNARTQLQIVECDRLWATRIARLAKLRLCGWRKEDDEK